MGAQTLQAAPAVGIEEESPRPISFWNDVWCLFVRPGELFSRLPQSNRCAFAAMVLICLQVLYAAGVISTGVMDYEIDVKTEIETSRLARRHEGEDKPRVLAAALDEAEKQAVFTKLIGRLLLLLGGPVRLLTSAFLLGSIFFVVVALKGGKPDFPVLTGSAIFASYVEVPRMLVGILLLSQLRLGDVDISAAALVFGPDVGLPAYVFLRRLDPFVIWYWCLLALALWKTGQLSRRTSVIAVCVMAVLTALGQSVGDVIELTK